MVEHPAVNRQVVGSSPTLSAKIKRLSRDRAVWQLVGLITRRSQVQILLPQPKVYFYYGEVAQLARAFGSYPECQRFKSVLRYHFFYKLLAYSTQELYGSMVKRLRHQPLTLVSRVRIPVESPRIKALWSSACEPNPICVLARRLLETKLMVVQMSTIGRQRHLQQSCNIDKNNFVCYNIFKQGPMVKRLRHHPFTVVSRVRISVGSPKASLPG